MIAPRPASLLQPAGLALLTCLVVAAPAVGALAAHPPNAPGAQPSSVEAWRDRLLKAADDAERSIGAILEDAIGTPGTAPARPNGLHLVEADGVESLISADAAPVPTSGTSRAVLLVHGLDEPGSIWDELIPHLQKAGHTVVRFDYPNDQPAARSADLLAASLETLRAAGYEHVDLVCHSMGGLLAMDVLTRPSFHAARKTWPQVDRYITLGTPFGGSPFARLRALAEVRDRVERWLASDRKDRNALLDWSSDGNGEAGDDLMPGSAYLKDLVTRPFPEGLATTAIIARVADVTPPDLSEVTDSWLFRRVAGDSEVESITAVIRRASLEVGDGVVPESSARAIAFDDTVVVVGNHRDMIGSIGPIDTLRHAIEPAAPRRVPPAIPVIIDRLATPIEHTDAPTKAP